MVKNFSKLIALLIFSNLISSLAIDIHLPFSNEIVSTFKTTQQTVQFLIAISLCITTITPLIWGVCSDYLGRRSLFITACFFMVIGHCIDALATSMTTFIVGRFLQCVGSGALITVSMAIVCDLYKNYQRAKRLAILEMTFTLGLILAPVLGSELYLWFGFRICYFFLACAQLALAISLIFFLPETLKDKKALQYNEIFTHAFHIAFHKEFAPYALLRALINGCYILFISFAPFIFIKQMGLSMREFGIYQSFLPLVYLIGLACTRPLLKRYTFQQMMNQAMCGIIIFLGMILMLQKGYVEASAFLCFLIFSFCSFVSAPLLLSAMTLALGDNNKDSGLKSALLEIYMGIISSFLVYIASYANKNNSVHTLYNWIMLCILISLCIWVYIIFLKTKKSSLSKNPVT